MEVSEKDNMKRSTIQDSELDGFDLMDRVIGLTGLPEELIRFELEAILTQSGQRPHDLTLEQLRTALMDHLQWMHDAK
jgi:hypothetical protein